MNDFCFHLNFDLDSALVPGIREKLCEPDTNEFIPMDDASVFNQDWVKYMKDIGLPFTGAAIIPYTADQHRLIHIDSSPDPDKVPVVAFNAWLHPPNDTQIVWYKWPKEEPIKRLVRPTVWYWADDVKHEEIYRHPLSFTHLYAIRIDIPHTATPGKRFVAISLRTPIDYFTTWTQVYNQLENYIL